MDFKNEIKKLSVQMTERKKHIINEEMTKQSLIIPFLQCLGYDVFNPLEVRPEYVADFGIKKGEKVDYALFKNGVPIMFIEVKSVTEKLDKHNSQLSRYFNATPEVKIGILTNGMEYKFYTDLTQDNIMDSEPFYSFNIETLTVSDIETIENFSKEKFDSDRLVKFAEELLYMSNLHSSLRELFRNPSDDFLRFLIKDFSNSRITSNVIERFRPIVKKAINNTLLEIISEGLAPREETASNTESSDDRDNDSQDEELSTRKRVITTEEELKSSQIIKEILESAKRDTTNIDTKDTTNYFTMFYGGPTKWFIRLAFGVNEKYIITRFDVDYCSKLAVGYQVEPAPKGMGESRVKISSIDELNNLRNLIIACFDDLSHE